MERDRLARWAFALMPLLLIVSVALFSRTGQTNAIMFQPDPPGLKRTLLSYKDFVEAVEQVETLWDMRAKPCSEEILKAVENAIEIARKHRENITNYNMNLGNYDYRNPIFRAQEKLQKRIGQVSHHLKEHGEHYKSALLTTKKLYVINLLKYSDSSTHVKAVANKFAQYQLISDSLDKLTRREKKEVLHVLKDIQNYKKDITTVFNNEFRALWRLSPSEEKKVLEELFNYAIIYSEVNHNLRALIEPRKQRNMTPLNSKCVSFLLNCELAFKSEKLDEERFENLVYKIEQQL